MSYTIKLDTVQGHEVDQGVGEGRIVRTGLIKANSMPVGFTPSSTKLTQALLDAGMPAVGDVYPDASYPDYYLKRHIIRAITYKIYSLILVYEWRGQTVVRDSSNLNMVKTQIHPADNKPIFVEWENPLDASLGKIKKLANPNTPLPLRHLTIQKTVDFMASATVLDAFGSVNDATWQGLPKAYWLLTTLEGETHDDGITYTYTAIWSTKQKEDWSDYEFLTDDRGRAIVIPDATVVAARTAAYTYGQQKFNGITKLGMFPLKSFSTVFGI